MDPLALCFRIKLLKSKDTHKFAASCEEANLSVICYQTIFSAQSKGILLDCAVCHCTKHDAEATKYLYTDSGTTCLMRVLNQERPVDGAVIQLEKLDLP